MVIIEITNTQKDLNLQMVGECAACEYVGLNRKAQEYVKNLGRVFVSQNNFQIWENGEYRVEEVKDQIVDGKVFTSLKVQHKDSTVFLFPWSFVKGNSCGLFGYNKDDGCRYNRESGYIYTTDEELLKEELIKELIEVEEQKLKILKDELDKCRRNR